jgi:putative SOS response-associated peptidase YedK
MCGRFTIRSSPQKVAEVFGLSELPLFEPRYNVAPTQQVPTVRTQDDRRELAYLRWGLIPGWADDPKIGSRMINARADTVTEKPSYRKPLALRRCLIVADGFYEWQSVEGKKQPYFIRLRDDRPFGLAGLWERWTRGEQTIESCTIVTTEANAALAGLHDRMPVILDPPDFERWLDPAVQEAERLTPLLRPYSGDDLIATPVSNRVNSPTHEGPQCLAPAP